MPESIDEGDSRACDHGSVGGSMDITDHQGMGGEFVHAEQQVKTTVTTTVKPSRSDGEEASALREVGGIPQMSAAQMRQAVVMAEILKRPAERFGRRPIR